ncbi:MAG: MATE family efflux transporter [Bryobacterales bacterium]|nr:MATE family efflux transporter [Bryobacterales bacterium]
MLSLSAIRRELPPMTKLALPVVLAELGWMAMTVVDTMMVGRLSAEAIGAVSFGALFVNVLTFFSLGLLLGLDTLISQAFGANNLKRCNHCLIQGVWIAVALTPLVTAVAFSLLPVARNWGADPRVVADAIPYLKTLVWSTLPLLLYVVFRRYLQSMNRVAPVMFALVSANLVNALVNWLLVFGSLGFPALGVEGAGWATFFSRVYMFAVLAVFVWIKERAQSTGLFQASRRFDWPVVKELVVLGFPVAMQISAEYGVFALATAFIARLDALSLAAHQIALNVASVTFMVPLGVSSAGAVRVGQAVGRRDALGAVVSGWTAILLGTGFMLCAAAFLFLCPEVVLRIFTTDRSVFGLGVSLLFLAAAFQFFDGIQVTAGGVLRGIGDTRTPMFSNLVGHWLLGLPVGYALCFWMGWEAVGIWVGLSLGLIFVAIALLWTWHKRSHHMREIVANAAAGVKR